MVDVEPISTLPVDHPRHAHIAADATGRPQHAPTSEKHEGVVAQAKDVLTGRRNVTQVEHAQINEAIAQGIADNVDDFMVSHSNLNDKHYNADVHRHSYKRQTKPTNENVV